MKHGIPGQKSTAYALLIWTMVVYAFLYLPIFILILFSFNCGTTTAVWSGWTLAWYRQLFHSPDILRALKNSLVIAALVTVLSVGSGTLAAFAMHKYAFRGKAALTGLVYINLIVPEIVAALSLLLFLMLLKVRLGVTTIIIGHTVFCIASVIIIVRARLHGFDRVLEEVSLDLGATPAQTFRYVTLPLIRPGILSAALLCFLLSLDNFVLTFFLQGPGFKTLPVYIYSKVRRSLTPEINALTTIFLLVTMTMIVVGSQLGRKAR